jgi:hypothetical protein
VIAGVIAGIASFGVASSSVVTAQESIFITGGSTATIPGTYATGTYFTIGVSDGGRLSLLSGTVTAYTLSLSGTGALEQAGGRYAVETLQLSDSTTVRFEQGDTIGRTNFGSLYVDSGSVLQLWSSLTGTNGVAAFIDGAGSGITRGTGSETLDLGFLSLSDGANLTLIPGDTIGNTTVGVFYGFAGSDVATSTLTLAPGTTTVDPDELYLGRGGRIAGLETVPYEVMSLGVAGQRIVFRSGTITDSITDSLELFDSGTLALQQPLAIRRLAISGSESRIERAGFAVATSWLDVRDGAAVTVGPGFAVSESLEVSSGYGSFSQLPTSLTLETSLVLSASNGSPNLSLSGVEARLIRSPGVTITATGGYVTVTGGSFAMLATDTFTDCTVGAYDGAVLANEGSLSCASVSVVGANLATGKRSLYAARGPLVVGGTGGPALSTGVTVIDGTFRVHAGATAPIIDVYDGVIDLVSGTLTVGGAMSVSGSAATITANPAGGTAMNLAALSISGGATVTVDPVRDAVGALTILAGSTFALNPTAAQLTLSSLSMTDGLFDAGNGGASVASDLSTGNLLTLLLEGRGDGSWSGATGITSSAAAAAVAAGIPRTMGWLDNGDGSVAFAFAAEGDTNLDWQVDILDAANFLAGGKFDSGLPASWNEGDFGYDGLVDILDAADFLSTGLFDTGGYNTAAAPTTFVAVPEPAGWGWCGACGAVAAAVAGRRRRFGHFSGGIMRWRSARVPASAGSLSRRQRMIRGNLTATPDLCRVDRDTPSKASCITSVGVQIRTGPCFSIVVARTIRSISTISASVSPE